MSPPECPPRTPDTVTATVSHPSGTGSGTSARRTNVWALPAQPTVSAPLLVPSRFTSSVPRTSDGSSAFAPSRPCSSDTVKSSSSGPCATSGSSAIAIAAATPIPLSAPSVVSRARTQSSSRTTSIRPSRGSLGLSGSRSQTMSRWDWRTTVGASSRPSLAGTRTTAFPSASTAVSSPCSAAQASTWARTSSSCFGGRGMRVSARKCVQIPRGSSSASVPLTGAG